MYKLLIVYAGTPASYLIHWFSSHNGTDNTGGGGIADSHITSADYIQTISRLGCYYFNPGLYCLDCLLVGHSWT